MHYILNADGEPERVDDILAWATWFDARELGRVALDELPNGYTVSTVFLGIDHNFSGGPPILWETCIFWPEHGARESEVVDRYSSRDEALKGHAEHVAHYRDMPPEA